MTQRGRRRAAALALVAAATVSGCATAPGEVREAAATRTAAPGAWFLEAGGVVPPASAAPPAVGLAPVIPRPVAPQFVPPVVPRGLPLEERPPPAVCGGYGSPRQITPGAVPGPGSATISWQADGRPEVVGYRVQAVSQTLVPGAQPAPPQQNVAQPAGCRPVTVTLTGLARGGVYVFWLEEAVTDPQTRVTRLVQVGTSAPVTIG